MDTRPLKWLLLLWVGLIHSQGPLSPINVTYRVAEEKHNPVIGHLLADGGLQPPPRSQVQLQILRGQHLELFYVTDDNLMTVRPLDREILCVKTHPCIIQLDVTVLVNSQLNWILNVEIEVLDINDNNPVFQQPNVTIEIPEESEIGTTFDLPAATDKDIGQNSIQGYAISSDIRNTFSVHNYEGPGGVTIPKLVLNSALRRDQTEILIFELSCFDGGVPLKSGSIWITVDVIYSNDHPPQFDSSYEVNINENSDAGYLVTIEASDIDSGNNGEISYSFNNGMQVSSDGVLSINNTSGDVVVLVILDHERQAEYRYTIVATDRGNVPLSASTQLMMYVTDLNDSPPVITIDTLTHANYSLIPESSPLGTFIALVTVTDADSSLNGEVNCNSLNNGFQLTHMYANDHQLKTAAGLNYESQANYSVEIECIDKGQPPLMASVTLDIYVSDVNDNPPIFERAFYNLSIEENLTVNTPLIRVKANDIDSGVNGRINYYIEEDNIQRWLSVESGSGLITTLVSFDHENDAQAHVELTVIARDNGTPPRTASARIHLNIIDTNDEAPIFSAMRNFRIAENADIGSSLGRVRATDPDGPPFNTVEYFISNDTFDSRTFSIDKHTGELKTLKSLDREHRPSYYFTIFAKDTFTPYHTSSAEITVSLADENDNGPIVIFPTSDNNTVHIPLQNRHEYEVTRILATDADSGINARLQYTILNGNDDGCFNLDSEDGSLFVNGSCLSVTMKPEYIFNVIVEDLGRPPKFSYPILYIEIDSSAVFGGDSSTNFVNTTKPRTWRLEYHHKVSLVLGSLTVLLLLVLVCAIVIIKAKQRKQSNNCAKYMNSEEMTRLRRANSINSSEQSQIPEAARRQRAPMMGPEQDQGGGDSSQGQQHTSPKGQDGERRFAGTDGGGLQDEGFNPSDPDSVPNTQEPGPADHNEDVETGPVQDPAAMHLHNAGIVHVDDGTPADMQLYKLLRFLNEVQRNEQQMVSSTTESTQNMTELSAPDSGTGMSEEEVADEYFLTTNSSVKSPTKSVPRISYVFNEPGDHLRHPGNLPNQYGGAHRGSLPKQYHGGVQYSPRRKDILEPDEFYKNQTHSNSQPKIVVNTKQKSRNHKPNTFNLKSPRKTLAKLKLLQSLGSQPSKDTSTDSGSLYHTRSMPDRCASTGSSTETQSPSSSVQSMNSAQTFSNSRQPVTLGTFKPELCQTGYIDILQPVANLLQPVETDI